MPPLTIKITDLGPVHEREIAPNGTITAPSQSGKTTALTALCWGLTGTDEAGNAIRPEYVRDGADAAEVTIEGAHLQLPVTRRITAAGSKSQKVGEAKTSGAGVASLIGLDGREELARMIMSPLLWQSLQDSKRGRPLADLIQSVLPPVDPRAEIAEIMSEGGLNLADGDALDEQGATDQQRAANARESEATGALETREAVLAELTPPTAPDGDADAARAVVEEASKAAAAQKRHAEWSNEVERLTTRHAQEVERIQAANDAAEQRHADQCDAIRQRHEDAVTRYTSDLATYDARLQKAEAAKADRETRAAEIKAWQAKRDALGSRPASPGDTIRALTLAESRVASAAKALDASVTAGKAAKAQMARARKEAPDTACCGTCERPWDEAAARMIADAEAAVEQATADYRAARAESDAADKALTEAKEAHAAAEQAREKIRAYDAAVEALGPKPLDLGDTVEWPERPTEPPPITLPDAPEPKATPDAPEMPEEPPVVEAPPSGQVGAAKATVAAWEAHEVAVKRHEEQEAAAAAAVEAAKCALTKASTEAVRVRALVAAVRAAPARIAAKQAQHLGDLGPVTLRWGATATDQAVEVLIDGRRRASNGRTRYADLYLRAALRRASGLDWLPIVVDDATAWSGEWPEIPGVLYLRTATGEWTFEPAAI